jgi:hypothetical protein
LVHGKLFANQENQNSFFKKEKLTTQFVSIYLIIVASPMFGTCAVCLFLPVTSVAKPTPPASPLFPTMSQLPEVAGNPYTAELAAAKKAVALAARLCQVNWF